MTLAIGHGLPVSPFGVGPAFLLDGGWEPEESKREERHARPFLPFEFELT